MTGLGAALSASASPPPISDLWGLIRYADRVVWVEIESVRTSRLTAAMARLAWLRGGIVGAARSLDTDFGNVVDGAVPEVEVPRRIVTECLLLSEVSGQGWVELEVPKRLTVVDESWHGALAPGRRAVLFLNARIEGWAPIYGYANAVIDPIDDTERDELLRVVAAGWTLPAGPPPAEWSTLAWSLPGSRLFTNAEPSSDVLGALATALLERPTHTFADVELLGHLEAVDDPRLDDLALAWGLWAYEEGDALERRAAIHAAARRFLEDPPAHPGWKEQEHLEVMERVLDLLGSAAGPRAGENLSLIRAGIERRRAHAALLRPSTPEVCRSCPARWVDLWSL